MFYECCSDHRIASPHAPTPLQTHHEEGHHICKKSNHGNPSTGKEKVPLPFIYEG